MLPSDEEQTTDITDGTLIVRPEVATEQRKREQKEDDESAGTDDGGGGEHDDDDDGSITPPKPDDVGPAKKTRFFGTKQLSGERYAMDFKSVADEILSHLAATPGAKVTITLDIEAVVEDGFAENTVRTVSENANTLKFEQSGFEEE